MYHPPPLAGVVVAVAAGVAGSTVAHSTVAAGVPAVIYSIVLFFGAYFNFVKVLAFYRIKKRAY